MNRRWRAVLFLALASVAVGCATHRPPTAVLVDAPPADLIAATASLYRQYGAALAAGRREAIAGFYHPDGAHIVFNGTPRRQTRAQLHERYLTAWSPPAYFAWEPLSFDPISPRHVLVTGGFRSFRPTSADTTRYVYAALVVAVDSGMAIVFEHETLRPTGRD